MVKYVSVITDYTYLLWQQELQIFNFERLSLLDKLVVVVLHDPGKPLSEHALSLSKMAEVHYFENDQKDRSYIPSNKPWGLMKLLEKKPEYGKEVFLLDSDVIFRERLDFNKINRKKNDPTWYVSNTVGYIGYEYLKDSLEDDALIDEMAGIVGLDAARLKAEQMNSGGAQYYMKDVKADFCRKVAEDSTKIYAWAVKQINKYGDHKIQVWTAEMWSWLWNAFLVAPVKISYEMRFSWAPHDIYDWYACKMMHLAGVIKEEPRNFYKGKYAQKCPWDAEKDFITVDRTKCWGPYVELIESYKKLPTRRGVVCYLEDTEEAAQHATRLFKSIQDTGHTETDLILFGSVQALAKVEDHKQLVKVVANPYFQHHIAPEMSSYQCFKNHGTGILLNYGHLLKTNVSTVLKPSWKDFRPDRLTTGRKSFPAYTFYGPASQVVEVCTEGFKHAKTIMDQLEHRAPFYSVYCEIHNRVDWFDEHLDDSDLPWVIENNMLI